MTCSMSRWLTLWKHCSLWIDITGDSVHNMSANVWICLVYEFITSVIAYNLQQTYLIELERGKRIRYHHTEFEEISNESDHYLGFSAWFHWWFFSQVKQRLMELYGDEILMIVAELPIQGLVLSRKTRSLLAVSFAVLINHTSSFYSPSHPPITSVDSFVSFLSRSTLAWPPLPSPTISPPP